MPIGVFTPSIQRKEWSVAASAGTSGIAYEWFPELGNPDRQDPEIRAFEQLMAREAESRLQRLRTCVQALRACLLCAEQDAQRCHRRIITAYLTAYGYDVQHL